MPRRLLSLLVMCCALLATPFAQALGLGELELESGLNEPLRARIPLIKVGDLTEQQLLPQLGSEEAFRARNLSRDFILTKLRFAVDLKHPKGPSILLQTDMPVKEPSLEFLLELMWPTGKMQRVYTILLEKPPT